MPQRITTEYGKTIFYVWDVPEYTKYPHSRTWYVSAAVFLLGCIAYSIFVENNYLFAFILLLITVIFVFHEMQEPVTTQFGITERGIVWRGFLFGYKEIRSFWIIDDVSARNIYFVFKNATTPRMTIPLDDQNVDEIREVLKKYLIEDESHEQEPLSDVLGRALKF
jgi:hypothetical protein